jgi:hypothetical protein
MSRKWATGIILVALAGCMSTPTPFDCVTVGPVVGDVGAFDAAAQKFYGEVCRYEVRCGSISASEEGKCNATYLGAMANDADFLAHYRHQLLCGAIAFDASVANDCLARIDADSCRLLGDDLVNCLTTFVAQPGWVEDGARCLWDSECKSGQCFPMTSGCGGLCKPLPQQMPGPDPGSVPEGGNCLVSDGKGGFYDDDGVCQPGLRCRGNNVCTAQGGDGTPCADQWDCLPGFFCDGPVDYRGGTCRGTPAAAGEPCSPDSQRSCAEGLACDRWSDGVPTCRVLGTVGVSCADPVLCADGLVCAGLDYGNGTTIMKHPGTCSVAGDLGAACHGGHDIVDCKGDMDCSAAMTCVLHRGWQGDVCAKDGCNDGLFCDGGHCDFTHPRGAACTPPGPNDDNPCANGHCDSSSHNCVGGCDPDPLF